MDRTDWAEHYKDLWIKAKARADAAEALAKEEGEARDHWFDLATYEVGGVPQHWKDRAEKAEATIADLTAKLQAAEAEHRFSLGLVDNAQVTIASLTEQLAEAREALKPFAELPDASSAGGRFFLQLLVCPEDDEPSSRHYGPDIRRARATLSGAKDERETIMNRPTEKQIEAARIAGDEAWKKWTGGRSSLDGMEVIVRAALSAALERG